MIGVGRAVRGRSGLSLVELIVALLILTVGIFALGASSIYVLTQVRASQLHTERSTAVRDAAERVRSLPWSTIPTECQTRTFESGRYRVTCSILPSSSVSFRVIQLVSDGPGYRGGEVVEDVPDTSVISVARPAP